MRRLTFAALAATMVVAPATLAGQQAHGSLGGVVRDTERRPIPSVRVSAGDDTTRFVLSDSAGQFRVPGLAPGTYRVRFRRLGFVPAEFPLAVEAGEDLRVQVELAALATPIEPITVTERFRPSLAERGFYERQRLRDLGALQATFMGPDEIESRRATHVSHLLAGVRGIIVQYAEGRTGRRGTTLLGRNVGRGMTDSPTRCRMTIWIDGFEIGHNTAGGYEPGDVDAMVNIGDVGAIEVYISGSTIPAQFQTQRNPMSCGAVVIWTKRER